MNEKFSNQRIFRVTLYILTIVFTILSLYKITTPSVNEFNILIICTITCIVVGIILATTANGRIELTDAVIAFIFMYFGLETSVIFSLLYWIIIGIVEFRILGRRRRRSKLVFNTAMFTITTYFAGSIVNVVSHHFNINKGLDSVILVFANVGVMPIVLMIVLYVAIFLIINISIYKIDYFLELNKIHRLECRALKLVILNFLISSIIGSTLYIIGNISGILGIILITGLLVLCNYGMYISTKLEIKNESINGLVKITSDIVKYGDFRDKSINLVNNLKNLIPYDMCAFYLFDIDNGGVVYPIAYTGPDIIDIGELGLNLSDNGITIKKIREGKIYISKDVARDKKIGMEGNILLVCITMVLVPILVDGKVSGLIIIGGSDKLIDFTSNGIEEMLSILSNQLSLAIENNIKYEEIKDKAYIDELSNLYNRRTFENEINKLINEGTNFSLVLYDIDDFKLINDTYGHLAGDEVIRRVSDTIKKSIRKTDIACRYGGEEIVVIFKGLSKEDAYIISERIRRNIESTVTLFNEDNISITVSGGVSAYPKDGKNYYDVIKKADEILYKECKQKGKNRVCVYN